MKYLNNSNGKSTQDVVAANIQFLMEQLEAGHSEVLTHYLTAMARFHGYSFGNILLIARQKPNATNVAGMFTWRQLGRRVRRGERGIMIFAPMLGRKKIAGQGNSAERAADTSAAKEQPEQAGISLVGFRPVYVWDVEQTEGKELPRLEEVRGNVQGRLARLVNFLILQDIKFGYSDEIAPAKGVSYGGAIRLLPVMNEAEQFATLVHETAHELIHQSERRTLVTKTVRETEAEAIAFVVCKAIGLETGTASADYVHLYHGSAKLLQESLEVVQRTSAVILGAVNPEVREPQPQRAGG